MVVSNNANIMETKIFIKSFLLVFGIALIANILVTLCWNYFIKGIGAVIDWETGFRTALVFAIIIPIIQRKGK